MKTVILISGKISSGKNTLTDLIMEELKSRNIPVVMDYFAKPLKDMCKEAFRPLINHLNEIFAAMNCPLLITKDENFYENKNEITRHILQIVGTDIVRTVNNNYWAESFVNRTNARVENIVVNSDCRFPSEIKTVEEAFDTIKIRVERNLDRNGSINEHVSEKALDDYEGWDYLIDNNGTLDDLRECAKNIVDDLEDRI